MREPIVPPAPKTTTLRPPLRGAGAAAEEGRRAALRGKDVADRRAALRAGLVRRAGAFGLRCGLEERAGRREAPRDEGLVRLAARLGRLEGFRDLGDLRGERAICITDR